MHLLKLEWLKQKQYTIFRIICLLYVIGLPSLLLIGKSIDISEAEAPPMMGGIDAIFMFPDVWKYLGYIGNWLAFFLFGFLSVLMITSEFTNKTLRQNIITGLSRTDYFKSKVFFILALSTAATVYYVLCVWIYGLLHTYPFYMETALKNADYVYRFFLMCVGYMSVGMLFGLLIRRTGIALFLYLAYAMFIENIIRYAIHLKIFAHNSMRYYPLNAMEDLTPVPFSEMADGFVKSNGFSFFLSPLEATVCAIIYTVIFLGLSWWRLEKADL